MAVSVGINGFGRIGRLACRVAIDTGALDIVRINDPSGDAGIMAHLLEFDSIHGRWPHRIEAATETLRIDNSDIAYSGTDRPEDTDWSGVDLLIESSGRFRTHESLNPCLDQGVRKVVVSAPIREPDAINIVMGVNESRYDPSQHNILSAASCTTNCLAPVVKVLHEGIGIERGTMTTIHDLTNTQTLIDSPHEDWRRARASGLSLIPTSTGSAKAIGTIFPELIGKLDGLAVRVPLMNASLTDCAFCVARDTDVDEINQMLQTAASGSLHGILGYETRPLVSIDYRGDPRSSIVDGQSTRVIDRRLVKVLAWYDNEWGYANRLVELAAHVARNLQ